MVKIENGEIVVGFLDDTKVLSKSMIENYDYKGIKEDFDKIVEILEMNKLYHSVYREKLNYEINDHLEFITFTDEMENYTISSNDAGSYLSKTDGSVFTLDIELYKKYYELCELLLLKIKSAWSHLNEVEKFIIKSLEFANPSSTDEELQDKLMYCNKKYYQYKKSGFIKLGTELQLGESKGKRINIEEFPIVNGNPHIKLI